MGPELPVDHGEGCGGIEAGIKSPVVTERSEWSPAACHDRFKRIKVAARLWQCISGITLVTSDQTV
jgi:hypothetical protein